MGRKALFLLLLLGSTLASAHQRTDSVELPVAKYLHNARAAVSYTFDDGLLEHYTLVFPRLIRLLGTSGLCQTAFRCWHSVGRNLCRRISLLQRCFRYSHLSPAS